MSDTSFEFPLKDDEFKLFGFSAKQAYNMRYDEWAECMERYDIPITYVDYPAGNHSYHASKEVNKGYIVGSVSYTIVSTDPEYTYEETPYYNPEFLLL